MTCQRRWVSDEILWQEIDHAREVEPLECACDQRQVVEAARSPPRASSSSSSSCVVSYPVGEGDDEQSDDHMESPTFLFRNLPARRLHAFLPSPAVGIGRAHANGA